MGGGEERLSGGGRRDSLLCFCFWLARSGYGLSSFGRLTSSVSVIAIAIISIVVSARALSSIAVSASALISAASVSVSSAVSSVIIGRCGAIVLVVASVSRA